MPEAGPSSHQGRDHLSEGAVVRFHVFREKRTTETNQGRKPLTGKKISNSLTSPSFPGGGRRIGKLGEARKCCFGLAGSAALCFSLSEQPYLGGDRGSGKTVRGEEKGLDGRRPFDNSNFSSLQGEA